MSVQITRRDLPWVVLIIVSFIIGLAVSWERWGNPLVDCGREMNQPLRLASGEMLYSDVRHIYGPLSPYLNAGLYLIFGPSLSVLYANGILSALIIIGLVYWISLQVMGRPAAAAAALMVMWICAFKQAGNYVLPYSYSALHGCALGLATLALLLKGIQVSHSDEDSSLEKAAPAHRYLVGAGLLAGLTVLAKTEMGFAAVGTGAIAAILIYFPNLKRCSIALASFLVPALGLFGLAYALIGAKVGWNTLLQESFLFLQNLPPELVYFNKRMSGFDQPWLSLAQMVGSFFRISALALLIASISLLMAKWWMGRGESSVAIRERRIPDSGKTTYAVLWALLILSLLLFVIAPSAGGFQWDKGPYLAMPIVLLALLIATLIQYRKQLTQIDRGRASTLILLAVSVYALLSLTRVILRVRSGGAYSSYLLPVAVILFTYCWAYTVPSILKDRRYQPVVRKVALAFMFVWIAVTAVVVAHRFRANNTYPVTTARGTIVAIPDLGLAFDEAVQFINRETAPTDPIAVLPEGTSLNFFTDRRNPLREEITTPGYLDASQEERAIRQLVESNTEWILLTNRATPEFGAGIFGKNYNQRLMNWIDENFEPHAMFGPDRDPGLQIGGKTFFIRAYRKKATDGF